MNTRPVKLNIKNKPETPPEVPKTSSLKDFLSANEGECIDCLADLPEGSKERYCTKCMPEGPNKASVIPNSVRQSNWVAKHKNDLKYIYQRTVLRAHKRSGSTEPCIDLLDWIETQSTTN